MKKRPMVVGAATIGAVAVAGAVAITGFSQATASTGAGANTFSATPLQESLSALSSSVGLVLEQAPGSAIAGLPSTAPALSSVLAQVNGAASPTSASLVYATDSSHLTTSDAAEMPSLNHRLCWVVVNSNVYQPLFGAGNGAKGVPSTAITVVDANTGQFIESKVVAN